MDRNMKGKTETGKRRGKFGKLVREAAVMLMVSLLAVSCSRKNRDKAEQAGEKGTSAFETVQGAVVRGDTAKKTLSLVFTGDEYSNGGFTILKTLDSLGVKGGFFLTGKFYRNPKFKPLVQALKKSGHYLGPHGDQHLQYCDWSKRDSTLVTKEVFDEDLLNNYKALADYGVTREDAPYFLPAYEWYNQEIADWTSELGFTLINFTHGTLSHTDYTISTEPNYRDSETIYKSILDYETKHGLNGFILLSHIGVHPDRTDYFFEHLGNLIGDLRARGYEFVPLTELLQGAGKSK